MNTLKLFALFTLFIGALFRSHCAMAEGIVFTPSFMVMNWEDDVSNNSISKVNATYMDFKLGYQWPSGLYIGAIYATMDRNENSVDRVRTSYGGTLGFDSAQGIYLHGSYLISSTYKIDANDTLQSGTGLQFDFGYLFRVANILQLGPQITYRTFTYSKEQSSGVVSSVSSTKSTETLPFVVFSFTF